MIEKVKSIVTGTNYPTILQVLSGIKKRTTTAGGNQP